MKNLFLILFLTTFIDVSSQNNKALVDSLNNELKLVKYDSIRLKLYERLYSAELYSNPQNAKEHVTNAMNLSKRIGKKISHNRALYGLGSYFYITKELDSSDYYYTKSFKYAKENDFKEMIAKTMSSQALNENNLEKAIKMRDTANSILLEIGHHLNYAIGVGQRAELINRKGEHTKAYKESYKALRILDTIDAEPYRKADINIQLGNIEEKRGNREQAIKFYKKALDIFIETDDFVYQSNAYLNLGFTYFNMKNYDSALYNLNKGVELAKKYRLKGNYSRGLGHLGIISLHKENYTDAREYLEKGIAFDKQFWKSGPTGFKLLHLGRVEMAENNFSKAINYFDECLKLSIEIKDKRAERDVYRTYIEVFEKTNRFKKANDYTKLYVKLKDSLQRAFNNKEIEDLKIAYDTEKKEAAIALQKEEIKTLNVQAKNDKLTKTLYSIGIFSLLAIASLLYFGFKQRIKKNKIEREKQEEIYKQEIGFKKKELASQTLHLVQKNTFIQELKENLVKIKQSPELFKVEFRRLVMLLKKESAEDKDWEVFKSYFSEVHNNFDHKLKAIYEDISEKEMRLASFLRMNLSTKEIASMLNVLPDSVLKSKYRLKKKLNLDKETDLNHFLSDL
tara:strand:- start:28 stop:1896 length:1869 start_codon:yes stop_codon:yes gene_type:complete